MVGCAAKPLPAPTAKALPTMSTDRCMQVYGHAIGLVIMQHTKADANLTQEQSDEAVRVLDEEFTLKGTKQSFLRTCSTYNTDQVACMLSSNALAGMDICEQLFATTTTNKMFDKKETK